MITPRDAFERLMALIAPLTTERLAISDAHLRVLAAPLTAKHSKPGADMAAMDGYAVNSADLIAGETVGLTLLKGESRAGAPYDLKIAPGQAVRIATGAIVPAGADQVVPQEDVTLNEGQIALNVDPQPGRHIREEAADFEQKETLLDAGTLLTPKTIGLVAAGGYSHVMVHRAPRIALFASGDEIILPGTDQIAPHQMIDSASPMVAMMAGDAGAHILTNGHLPDDHSAALAAFEALDAPDLIITIGGASVGDHDVIKDALQSYGVKQDFWKLSMRPGKPMMVGKKDNALVISLPGNPVSAFVCAHLFVRPVIDAFMGRPAPFPEGVLVPCAVAMGEEGPRDHYYRARLVMTDKGPVVDPAQDQDSSLLSVLSACDGLLVRPAGAEAIGAGDSVRYLPF